jgi:hypothetical protein
MVALISSASAVSLKVTAKELNNNKLVVVPGASVYLDNVFKGKTDTNGCFYISHVSIGNHRISAKLVRRSIIFCGYVIINVGPSRSGYIPPANVLIKKGGLC